MRMWLLPVSLHCREHLLGAHVECHMLIGSLKKEKRLGRLLSDGFVDPSKVENYHAELAAEMIRRGYQHNSPLSYTSTIAGNIDIERNRRELRARCKKCTI